MIGSVLIFIGICSVIISSVGVIRFPDFYTRLHAAGITDSSGATLLLIGFALQNGFSISTVKIILLILIIWVASSTNGLAHTYYKVKKKLLKKVKVLEILNVVLLLLLLTVTVFIVFLRHLVVSAVLMCVFSSLIALIYLIMNAPDVAITEASVGAGLSTIFTFAALSLIKNHKVNLSHNPITLFFMLFLAKCHIL